MGEVFTFTLTEAKAKFPEIINCIIYKKETIIVTKKGKQVAVIQPPEALNADEPEGLIKARSPLPDMDEEIDDMVDAIYRARREERRIN